MAGPVSGAATEALCNVETPTATRNDRTFHMCRGAAHWLGVPAEGVEGPKSISPCIMHRLQDGCRGPPIY